MKLQSLNRNRDFARLYKKGKSCVDPVVVVYWQKNRVKQTRVGITASKKIGNAVKRNRARRVIRHALYEVLPENFGPYDLVVVARGKTPYCKTPQITAALKRILESQGLLK